VRERERERERETFLKVRGREEVPATTIIKSQQRIFEVSKMKFYPPLYYSSEKEKEKEKKKHY